MCVVTYLPQPGNGFILTSNRDEHTSRPPALPPTTYAIDAQSLLFPKDPVGGGTWIATSGGRTAGLRTACLLNGAFDKHDRRPPYRKSRGLVLLDYFAAADPQAFTDTYDFGGIEPFTLVMIDAPATDGATTFVATTLHELRWEGQRAWLRNLPANLPHIWSSVTLYDADVMTQRKNWLAAFLKTNPTPSPADLFGFHQTAGPGDPARDYVAKLSNGVCTVSITQVARQAGVTTLRYLDLLTGATVTQEAG